jgi:methylenetetrahydrofolate dehydrogenase (NADP+)/methenyltetrahydrofolate cyclohydrolase
MTALFLDGASLASRRTPIIAERSAAVRRRRGHAPALVIVAFADEQGRVPHVDHKLRMCVASGVEATLVVVPPGADTSGAMNRLHEALSEDRFDGAFVQFPFPDAIDGAAFAAAIPVALDVDIMTPVRTARFMNGLDDLAPVTVAAGLLLLEEYGVSIADRRGVVVAEENPFSLMFRAALALEGADMGPIVAPDATDLLQRVHEAELIVVAAASPGIVQSTALSTGAVAIDAGYFNPGGRGDIDVSGGVDHLSAISPVPGGIGPMTVSALIERVVLFAERDS